jgi:hypothetical protein
MDLTRDTLAAVPVVDVSGLEVPGLEALPRVGEDMVALGVVTSFLASLEVSGLRSDFDVLEVVAAWHRVTAASAAAELAAVAELAARPEVFGADDDPRVIARRAQRAPAGTSTRAWVGDEVAARLADSPGTSGRRVRVALELPVRFPRMWAELSAGRVSEVKARILVEGCAGLADDLARAVDARVAPVARRQPPSRLRQSVRRAVLRVDPATAVERRVRAEADRCVRVTPGADGMAELWALLPAVAATSLARALDDRARAAKAAGDARTVDQLRADALTEGVTGTVEVQVVVPASVLLGVGDDPAELVGHGPVDADLARTLAQDATWRRLLTDPDDDDDRLLSAGATTYRPGTVLTRHVVARDRTCRFPGCDRPARRCDLDHTVPFDRVHGLTVEDNLGPLCRHHHRFKHAPPPGTPPRLAQPAPGRFVWTMPTGHQHTVDPPALLEPDDPLLGPPLPAVTSLAEYALHHTLRGYQAGRQATRTAA